MDTEKRDKFINLWARFFNNSELPVTFQYSADSQEISILEAPDVPILSISLPGRTEWHWQGGTGSYGSIGPKMFISRLNRLKLFNINHRNDQKFIIFSRIFITWRIMLFSREKFS